MGSTNRGAEPHAEGPVMKEPAARPAIAPAEADQEFDGVDPDLES